MSSDVVAVRVPASAANLGPGFDALAAAVDVHLVARTAPRGPERVVSEGEGAGELPTDDGNLVWRCFVALCTRRGVDPPDVSVRVDSEIPLERGLGSSAAAAVAGAALARAVTGARATDDDIIDVAAEEDGHHDNAAAAALGGIVAVAEGRARRFAPAPGLRPVVCVPEQRQATAAARGILPEEVTLAEAAGNGGRAALVLAGLIGAAPLDAGVMRDVLHEPHRFTAMPASGKLVEALRGDGVAACLSGAGPTVLALRRAEDDDAVERVRRLAGEGWIVRDARWDLGGAAVCPPTVPFR